jgi:hypothetical protein
VRVGGEEGRGMGKGRAALVLYRDVSVLGISIVRSEARL